MHIDMQSSDKVCVIICAFLVEFSPYCYSILLQFLFCLINFQFNFLIIKIMQILQQKQKSESSFCFAY